MTYNSEAPFVNLERRTAEDNIMSSTPDFEMENLKTVKTFIKAGRRKNMDEDGIYLKHDLEHTWSPTESANAEVGHRG